VTVRAVLESTATVSTPFTSAPAVRAPVTPVAADCTVFPSATTPAADCTAFASPAAARAFFAPFSAFNPLPSGSTDAPSNMMSVHDPSPVDTFTAASINTDAPAVPAAIGPITGVKMGIIANKPAMLEICLNAPEIAFKTSA